MSQPIPTKSGQNINDNFVMLDADANLATVEMVQQIVGNLGQIMQSTMQQTVREMTDSINSHMKAFGSKVDFLTEENKKLDSKINRLANENEEVRERNKRLTDKLITLSKENFTLKTEKKDLDGKLHLANDTISSITKENTVLKYSNQLLLSSQSRLIKEKEQLKTQHQENREKVRAVLERVVFKERKEFLYRQDLMTNDTRPVRPRDELAYLDLSINKEAKGISIIEEFARALPKVNKTTKTLKILTLNEIKGDQPSEIKTGFLYQQDLGINSKPIKEQCRDEVAYLDLAIKTQLMNQRETVLFEMIGASSKQLGLANRLVKSTTERLVIAEKELKIAQEKTIELTINLENAQGRIKGLEKELQTARGRIEKLERRLQNEKGRATELQAELQIARGRIKELEKKLQNEKGKAVAFEAELETKQDIITKLETEGVIRDGVIAGMTLVATAAFIPAVGQAVALGASAVTGTVYGARRAAQWAFPSETVKDKAA